MENNLLNQISFLCHITPNDADLGAKIRAAYSSAMEEIKTPERTCDIDDEDCISCGA